MFAYLTILFLVEGEPQIISDGFAPYKMPKTQCETSLQFTKDYLRSLRNIPTVLSVKYEPYDISKGEPA